MTQSEKEEEIEGGEALSSVVHRHAPRPPTRRKGTSRSTHHDLWTSRRSRPGRPGGRHRRTRDLNVSTPKDGTCLSPVLGTVPCVTVLETVSCPGRAPVRRPAREWLSLRGNVCTTHNAQKTLYDQTPSEKLFDILSARQLHHVVLPRLGR